MHLKWGLNFCKKVKIFPFFEKLEGVIEVKIKRKEKKFFGQKNFCTSKKKG